MIAVLCPGQGSQTPGMFSPWLEIDGVRARLDELGAAANLDLVAHGTTSDAETIRDTAVAQPLIVAASLVALREVLGDAPAAGTVDVTAGHSVGELAASAVAGVLTDAGAVGLVARRARAMAVAAAAEATGMSAVLGGDPDEVLAAIEAAGLVPANVNGGGQVVAAGSLEGLARLAEQPPTRARVIPLQVAGAFHSPFMAPARERLAPVLDGIAFRAPKFPVLSNVTGQPHASDPGAIRALMLEQVTGTTNWAADVAAARALGCDTFVEFGPGKVLSALNRRIVAEATVLPLGDPEGLREALARTAG